MKTIILYGELRKKFGREFKLNVASAGHAISALCKLVKGFEKHLVENSAPGYHVKVGREYLDSDQINLPSGNEVIRIVPYISGSGGAFKAILGIALVALAIYQPGFFAASGLFSAANALSFGISLALSGISEALFSPPKPPSPASRERNAKPSYSFDGPENTVEQGNPIPLCYGQLMVGSQVISAVTVARDI